MLVQSQPRRTPAPIARKTPVEVIVPVPKARLAALPPTTDRPQIAFDKKGLTIRHATLFHDPASASSRLFLSRAFGVDEVESIEIDGAKGLSCVRYRPGTGTGEILRKLRTALTSPAAFPPVRPGAAGRWFPARWMRSTWRELRRSA